MKQVKKVFNIRYDHPVHRENSRQEDEGKGLAHVLMYKKLMNDDEFYRASLDQEKGLLMGEDAFAVC